MSPTTALAIDIISFRTRRQARTRDENDYYVTKSRNYGNLMHL